MFDFETPPTWAFSWCYYFFVSAAAMVVVLAFYAIMTFNKVPVWYTLMNLVGGAVLVITGMTQFWMCRASLKQ
jgi:uncharacterized membrane protein